MSNLMLERGPLTDAFIAHLSDALGALDSTILVGDARKPEGGGWPQQPQEGDYAAYVTVATGEAVLRSAPTIRTPMGSWACGYLLEFFGAARAQADWVADRAREAAVSWTPDTLTLGEHRWSLTGVRFSRLGAITRMDPEDPPVWTGRDMLALWVDYVRG